MLYASATLFTFVVDADAILFSPTQSVNSIFYLMQFWSRVVTAGNYTSQEDTPLTGIPEIAPNIFFALVSSQLKREIDNPESLHDLLSDKQLPSILEAAYKLAQAGKYSDIVEFLLGHINQVAAQFQQYMNVHPPPPDSSEFVAVLERQLAWLIHIVTAVTHGSIMTTKEEDEILDANLVAVSFEVLKLHDQRLTRVRYFRRNCDSGACLTICT